MTSYGSINAVTDEVISRLNTNKVSLGNFTAIKERDEEPSVIANHQSELPMIVVMPLANNPDNIRMTMSDGGEIYHSFSLTIMGYYKFSTLDSDIRTMRNYAYICLDLFRGANSKVATAHIDAASVNPGYFILVDNSIYKWVVKFHMRMIEP